MRNPFVLCMIMLSALVFGIRPLSVEEVKALSSEIRIEPFSILCYGTRYTVETEWHHAPRVHFVWDSQTGYETLVESVFKESGYVIETQGAPFVGKIQLLGDDFLYWDFSFGGKRTTNRDAVVRKDETIRESISRFLNFHYAVKEIEETEESTTFPYLVLFKNRQRYEVADRLPDRTGVRLLDGQGFSVWRFTQRKVLLKETSTGQNAEGSVLRLTLDRAPVQAIDLEDAAFLYTLETRPAGILARVDGIDYETPFSILLQQGVHRLEVGGEERFFYLSEPTDQFLEIGEPRGILSIELDLPAEITLYRGEETVYATQSAMRTLQTVPFGAYTVRIRREAYEPIEETVEVFPGKRAERSYSMTPIPGAVFLRQLLDHPCQAIYVNKRWVILVESEKSVFMPLPTNETTAFYLEDRIIGAKGHFSYSCQTVYLDDIPFFRSSSPVVSVEPFEKEIWIFDAAGTLTVVNAQNKKTLWQRAVGYIPFWTHRSDRWLALLDIYGNFVLLEPQRGYFEVFKYRFGLLKVIDHVTTTPNMLRLYFSPDSVLTYSFDTRASHYEEGASFDANRIAPTEKGLQQGQEMFYPFEEPLRGFDIADGSIAVLYDRFYTVLFAPRE